MFFVYVLYNKRHKKIYIGQTKNLEERLNFHKERIFKNSFTSRFDGEWNIIYKEIYKTRKEALIREKQLKSYRGRQFLKKFIPL
ncbi:MAG: GIY-YIG nuclease family protein [Patescibacteria group bacterium]|nr:GIY-YIG nuclease family protein [Patescibacteria group bacterium]